MEFSVGSGGVLLWAVAAVPFYDHKPMYLFKNALFCSAVVFCACNVIRLLYVVFRVFRVVHKLDVRGIMNTMQ